MIYHMANKDNFLINTRHAKRIKGLSDEDAGKLFKSIFSFAGGEDEEEFELSERADLILDYIKEEINEASEKYKEVCEKRKKAVSKRYHNDVCKQYDTNATNVDKCTDMNTSATNNDNDNDNEYNSLKESMGINTVAHAREESGKSHGKSAYGIFRNVYLSDEEYRGLTHEVSEEKLNKAISLLSARIEKDGKYKDDSHAAVIRLWVLKAVDEEDVKAEELKMRRKKARGSPGKDKEDAARIGFDFELEDIIEKP